VRGSTSNRLWDASRTREERALLRNTQLDAVPSLLRDLRIVRRARLLGPQAELWPDWRHFAF
jgi:hypothetical protein